MATGKVGTVRPPHDDKLMRFVALMRLIGGYGGSPLNHPPIAQPSVFTSVQVRPTDYYLLKKLLATVS